jgi:hypothetical protein
MAEAFGALPVLLMATPSWEYPTAQHTHNKNVIIVLMSFKIFAKLGEWRDLETRIG